MQNAKIEFSKEPKDQKKFTENFNKSYSKYAELYDISVKIFPFWKTWIKKAIPHIRGPKVLEVSFGTGYLLTKYASKYKTFGLDYNEQMVEMATKNLSKQGINATLTQGNVESMPYSNDEFDTIVSTMAFSGYPDANKAMCEIKRVLKKGGRLILVDFAYPKNHNFWGVKLTKFMEKSGDIIRDMAEIFKKHNFTFEEREIGGFGSVHLFLAVNGK